MPDPFFRVKLHHETQGSGPPLLILHGFLGSSANWRSVARALSDLRTVILADLRSHGRSRHHRELSLPALASDIAELLRDEGHSGADVAGHSLGGKVAMQTALDHPKLLTSLIVLDIAPGARPLESDEPLTACLQLDLERITNREDAVAELGGRLGSESLARWLAMNLERDGGGLRWRIPLPILHDARAQMAAAVAGTRPYPGPTLFLRGARSGFVTDDDRQEIQALFPSATIETIENAGHWLHQDAFDEVVAKLRSFLQARDRLAKPPLRL